MLPSPIYAIASPWVLIYKSKVLQSAFKDPKVKSTGDIAHVSTLPQEVRGDGYSAGHVGEVTIWEESQEAELSLGHELPSSQNTTAAQPRQRHLSFV